MKNTRNVADLEHIQMVLMSIQERLRDQIDVEYRLRDYEAIEDELASSRVPQFELDDRIGIIFDCAMNMETMTQITGEDEFKRRREEIHQKCFDRALTNTINDRKV